MLAKSFELDMKIPKDISDVPPIDWLASEKLDGLRALWDSEKENLYQEIIKNILAHRGIKMVLPNASQVLMLMVSYG